MSDSDEILFDDIYELHEVIGENFARLYFVKLFKNLLRWFLEPYDQSNCILRKRTVFSRPKMFPSTNGRRVCCKDSGCGKIYSKSWSEPWWSQKGGNNLPHAKASTHCWTTWNVQASTAYMYWVLIYIKSTRLLTWYDGLHEYHLN